MWSAYQSLKMYHRRPSEDLGETNSIAAYCVDNAVLFFGITIENALGEREKVTVGKETHYEPLYTLSQLLDPAFRLPRPQPEPRKPVQTQADGLAALMALAGTRHSGVKRYGYVGPLN